MKRPAEKPGVLLCGGSKKNAAAEKDAGRFALHRNATQNNATQNSGAAMGFEWVGRTGRCVASVLRMWIQGSLPG